MQIDGVYRSGVIVRASALIMAIALSGCSLLGGQDSGDQLHSFVLIGGHFYGPGPIVPDTVLPMGYLKNIKFDIRTFQGYAQFASEPVAFLSDGKTKVNTNIDAGRLNIGSGDHPVLLVAVNGGRNRGREYYQLTNDYQMVWRVDLALDPGFAEGIIRVDDFLLTTGIVSIQQSAQSELRAPGGYDQAGTLRSGQFLAGRVGDYDQDGLMDGVVVAAPRVPISSTMLPGSPVGNKRGFKTDIEIPAHLALELTLRSITHFREPIATLIGNNGDVGEIRGLLEDIQTRISAARLNMDHALLSGAWSAADLKQDGFKLTDRIETLRLLSFVSVAIISDYPTYGGKLSEQNQSAITLMFEQLDSVLDKVSKINSRTGHTLPNNKRRADV